MILQLAILSNRLAIYRLPPASPVPDWAWAGDFVSITRTAEELSIVCAESAAPDTTQAERGWRALKVEGPLDFSLTGILAGLANTLAMAGISLFALSTYDTDYILIKEENLEKALIALRAAGYTL